MARLGMALLSLYEAIRVRGDLYVAVACWMLSRARQGRQRRVDMVDEVVRSLELWDAVIWTVT